ncbi:MULTISPECIES: inositol monophosphatase family protein [Cellulomonas]|uniref:inositol monophosphatase family protein n=1 Tax=Cellulomonas TaxID=1707 RepID=UPI0006263710|nr:MULTISPECIES: inositol monophosphatase family protein [Cellulomonas]MBO9567260.1 inositol monophosphatase [Cellulomonas iranensis]UCN13227.1 inositol monophosphatase [Cellulomonas iranensis]
MTVPAAPSVTELVAVAEEVARAAGRLVHDGRPETVGVAATKSSAVDVVTAMDLASEDLVRRTLARLRPDDAVLGEEGGSTAGTSGVTWVVDPIDGTVNYLYGLPAYAVSVAAVAGDPDPATWTVLAGCVHAPATGETWTAARGHGARLDGRPLALTTAPPLDRCLVGTGFGYVADRRRDQARVLAALLPQVRDVRRIGAAAIDLCQVATGRLDLYYERGLQPWDLAAASLVVQEAGGVVQGLRGAPAGSAMTVAGAAARVGELTTLLEDLDADTGP